MNKSNNNFKPQVLTSFHSNLPHHLRQSQGISNIKITNVQFKTSAIKHKHHFKPISTNYNSNLNVFLTTPSVNQDEKIKLSSETSINPNIKTHSTKVTTSHSYNNIFMKNSINSTNDITTNHNDSSLLKSTTSPFKQQKTIGNIFIKEEQKTEFQSKMDSLVEKIDGIIESNGWFSTEKRYKLYDEQRERLKNLKLEDKEGDCGKHVYVHRCKYYSFSLQQISHKLDDIYQMIYSSQDRSATKAAQVRGVNAMYDCAKRRRDWRKSEFKDKIVRLYNEIGKF